MEIDRYKATTAIEDVYVFLGLSKAEIIFYDSPYAVAKDKQLLVIIDENQIYGEEFTDRFFSIGMNLSDNSLVRVSSNLDFS